MDFKKGLIGIGSLLLLPLSASLVAAQNLPAPPFAINEMSSVLTSLFSGTFGTGEDIIARLLVFVLITVILVAPARKVTGNQRTGTVVALLVALMGVRFLSNEMIKGIFLPTEALAVGLSIIIPFVLFEAFWLGLDDGFPRQIRQMGHMVIAGVFIALWWTRWTDIGDLAYYYLIGTVLALLALWFDTEFRVWLASTRIGDTAKNAGFLGVVNTEKKLQETVEAWLAAKAAGNTKQAKILEKNIKNYTNAIKDYEKLF